MSNTNGSKPAVPETFVPEDYTFLSTAACPEGHSGVMVYVKVKELKRLQQQWALMDSVNRLQGRIAREGAAAMNIPEPKRNAKQSVAAKMFEIALREKKVSLTLSEKLPGAVRVAEPVKTTRDRLLDMIDDGMTAEEAGKALAQEIIDDAAALTAKAA